MKELKLKPNGDINPKSQLILGVDVARTGRDETALVILEKLPFDDNIFVSYMETLKTPDLNMAIGRVMYLDKFFNFKKIVVDTTGLGAGVTDVLKAQLGGKVEGVWYTQKIKAEMFNNLKILLMRNNERLVIPDHITMTNPIVKKMYYQFLSITQEYKDHDATRLPTISHESRSHDDIVNAMALAATYFSVKGKRNKTYNIGGFNITG